MAQDMNRARIIIALAVLKSKPPNQTCFDYVRNLRLAFQSHSPQDDNSWKKRALDLQNECQKLRDKIDVAQMQNFIETHRAATGVPEMSETPTSSEQNATSASLQQNTLGKKKAKRVVDDPVKGKGLPDSSVNLKTIQNLFSGPNFKASLAGGKLFQAMDTFFELAALRDRPAFPTDAFLAATHRCIDALSISLDYTVKKDLNFDRLRTLDVLVKLVLERSIPLVLSSSSGSLLDKKDSFSLVLLQLKTGILVPVVSSFFLLSMRRLDHLLHPPSKDDPIEQNDGRPLLLAFFQSVVSTILSLSRIPLASTRAPEVHRSVTSKTVSLDISLTIYSLILETLRHLEELTRSPDTQQPMKLDKTRRVRLLAVKDSFWYLCSVLHILIASQTRGAETKEASDLGDDNPRLSQLQALQRSTLKYFIDFLSLRDREGSDNLSGQDNFSHGHHENCNADESCACYGRATSEMSASPGDDTSHVKTGSAFTSGTGVKLDDMMRKMLLRVAESYFSLV